MTAIRIAVSYYGRGVVPSAPIDSASVAAAESDRL